MWKIFGSEGTVGYFCGGTLRKGPFRILGSPLKGWGTNFMGPIVNGRFDPESFLAALEELALEEGFAMVEVESPVLPEERLVAAGFEPVSQPTYMVTLTPGQPEEMWNRIDKPAQRQIRKARRHGLVVEDSSDPEIADIFYDQFVEVLARKNLFPPYDRSCPRLLFQFLKPLGLLFALAVRDANGKVIATGLFPHDGRSVYLWGAGSRIADWTLGPNDLLQWSLMERAAARGLRTYNMCGYGHFKSKFGGVLEHPKRWHKCYSGTARLARKGYEFYFQKRIRLRGWWQRVISTRRGA